MRIRDYRLETIDHRLKSKVYRLKSLLVVAFALFALSSPLFTSQEQDRKAQIEKAIQELDSMELEPRVKATHKLIELEADKEAEALMMSESADAEVKDRAITVVKRVKFLQQFQLQEAYKRDADWVESLADDAEKTRWASLIGAKLAKEPEFLSAEQRKHFAQEILKEKMAREGLKQVEQRLAPAVGEEAWFYVEALEHSEAEVRSAAAGALGQVAGLLGGKLSKETVHPLLGLLEDKEANVRSNAARALGYLGSLLKGKLLEDTVKALIGKLEDKEGNVRTQATLALLLLAGNLEGKPVEEVAKALTRKLADQEVNVRSTAAHALGQMAVMRKLEDKLAEDAVKALLGLLEDKDPNVRSNAATALGRIGQAGKLGGEVLDEAISAVENASEKEKEGWLRPTLDSALSALKQRKQELEEKKK